MAYRVAPFALVMSVGCGPGLVATGPSASPETEAAPPRPTEEGIDEEPIIEEPIIEEPIPAEAAAPTAPEAPTFDATLAEYSTYFETYGRYGDRAHNVRLAASALDGLIVPAGASVSFNEVVGPRERSHGYRFAPVIASGELTPGVGGGVCQAASTFHAAAFFAGLEIEVYQPHSRPSTYVPLGLDATVVYPDVDLVVRNPFPFPIAIDASSGEHTLTVRIRGRERVRHVALARQIHRGVPFRRREVEDRALPLGVRTRTQEGARGQVVIRTRLLTEAGHRWAERERLEYPATDEIFHVGTGRPVSPEVMTPASVR
jgi:vancomycin resistance protein YoaR